jgi:hypothetical protein
MDEADNAHSVSGVTSFGEKFKRECENAAKCDKIFMAEQIVNF